MDEIRDEVFLKAFGEKFKKLREASGMSNREFANQAGISHSQIHRIDTGQLNIKICTVKAIADTLGVSLSELLKGL